jgi:hypothetical protein
MAVRPSMKMHTQASHQRRETKRDCRPCECSNPWEPTLTIREIADELNLSFGTCQATLTQDLGMRRVSAKLVPRLLTQDQTEQHAANCCNVPKITLPSCQALSQEMNHGFMATTLGQNKCRNGRRRRHLGRRKRGKSGQMSR